MRHYQVDDDLVASARQTHQSFSTDVGIGIVEVSAERGSKFRKIQMA